MGLLSLDHEIDRMLATTILGWIGTGLSSHCMCECLVGVWLSTG